MRAHQTNASLVPNGSWSIRLATLVLALSGAATAYALTPDPTVSYYVPQSGSFTTPVENASPPPTPPLGVTATGGGTKLASRLFRGCPNNDGASSYPNAARIKIVVLDGSTSTPTPIAGIPATDICIVVNSGTPAQGYNVDTGADSIIANSAWNPGCPDFPSYAAYSPPGGFCIPADGPTDASGVTYLTLGGGTWNGTTYTFGRDASRKWGHYDANLEVYVQGVKIFGVWNSFYAPPATPFPSYELRVKSFDWAGGLAAITNQGERVTVLDFNGVANGIGVNNAISYWRDFDFSGSVTSVDLNAITTHLNHTCNFPSTP